MYVLVNKMATWQDENNIFQFVPTFTGGLAASRQESL
jgi:hypothetical protein